MDVRVSTQNCGFTSFVYYYRYINYLFIKFLVSAIPRQGKYSLSSLYMLPFRAPSFVYVVGWLKILQQ